MQITSDQLRCLNTLVSKLHIDKESKAMLVSAFTNGRETSSKYMQSAEAIAIIKHLKELDPNEPAAEKMRRKIISMAHEIGWTVVSASLNQQRCLSVAEGNRSVADMQRIDNWCEKFGYKHKHLNSYTYKELPTLVSQFENGPYKHYITFF